MIPIFEIAEKCGVNPQDIIPYGRYMAKVPLSYLDEKKQAAGKLVLVTAITPNKAGVGKTVSAISLAMGMCSLGKRAIVALREPSLGPSFGKKGGAAGGGAAQVLPAEDINLHFTGDFHAITAANNMLAALLDNYQFWNPDKKLATVLWRRVLDINDRALREVALNPGGKLADGATRTGFNITPASEIMALLSLSEGVADLEDRIGRIVLGFTEQGAPFTVQDLGATGALMVLLKDAILPNLVQTAENTPAIIHGGPFANIAHGCNSVVATKMGLSLADIVITEAGFGSDLGAEKFFNIKCRMAGLKPAATVIVVTTGALKLHGGVSEKAIQAPDLQALRFGMMNLSRHVENMRGFGPPVMVLLNRHMHDTTEEVEYIRSWCRDKGIPFGEDNGYSVGGAGSREAAGILEAMLRSSYTVEPNYTYALTDVLKSKIDKIAKHIYRAGSVKYSAEAEAKLTDFSRLGWDSLPVCIAKTQYSFSDDPSLINAPEGFELHIRTLVINAGAGFVVALAGDIVRMPGLPKVPNAMHIKLVNGKLEGLK